MDQGQNLPLASIFPPATRSDWLKLVDGVLKGRPFERLASRTYDGFAIQPLYERAPSAAPLASRAPGLPWEVMQRIELPDPARANAESLQSLANGATGLALVFAGAVSDYGFGIPFAPETLARVLEGVHLHAGVTVDLDLPVSAPTDGQPLAAALKASPLIKTGARIRLGFNPLAAYALGRPAPAGRELQARFAAEVAGLTALGLTGRLMAADGRPVHNAGGSEAQELAFVLASAVALLRALETAGIEPDAARAQIFFRLSADADQLLTTAKLRALRKLWASIEQACGLQPKRTFVAAETAWRMMTRHDPYVNVLRTTMATFAAAVGGADAITVLPFTAALGLPDGFARRLARNTQLILAEEANLARVADPGAGSGALEGLTEELCTAAWSIFQAIERAGGPAEALASGWFQAEVARVRAEREDAVAHRREPLIGTSEFPDLHELPVTALEPLPLERGEVEAGGNGLAPMRLSAPFERLRLTAEMGFAETGGHPRVFLATIGKRSEFTPRLDFARNFFAAGGFAGITADELHDPRKDPLTSAPLNGQPDLPAAFKASGTPVACVCSSDAAYEREGIPLVRALINAGAKHVYLAGRPKQQDALREAGVGTFIYAGCNALAVLQGAHAMLAQAGAKHAKGSKTSIPIAVE